jgi:hypothetical protein
MPETSIEWPGIDSEDFGKDLVATHIVGIQRDPDAQSSGPCDELGYSFGKSLLVTLVMPRRR